MQSDVVGVTKDAATEIQGTSNHNGVVPVGIKVKKAVSPKKYRTFAFLTFARF